MDGCAMNREAGKGSKQRPTDLKTYGDNFDAIFRKKPTEQEVDAVVERLVESPDAEVAIGVLDPQDPGNAYCFFDAYAYVVPVGVNAKTLEVRVGKRLTRRYLGAAHSKSIQQAIDKGVLNVTRSFESRDGVRFEPSK